jgi:NTE family protein
MAKEIGLVLQGGGALGAYEFGAVTQLVSDGFMPRLLSGVSIGAINGAAIAGARDGDIIASLKELWSRITFKQNPWQLEFLAKNQAMLGNPAFYTNRHDWWAMSKWTSLCDTSPMRETLNSVIDFDALNDAQRIRFCVTATNVTTGAQVYFENTKTRLSASHILASGSLPPAFPATEIDGELFWDGGLFDNTPLRPVIEMLHQSETQNLPIFVLDLVPNYDVAPKSLADVKNRMMELSFENRFWDEFGGPKGLVEHAEMIGAIRDAIPLDNPIRQNRFFSNLLKYEVLKNLNVIPATHQMMSDGMDFSHDGVTNRYQAGKSAVKRYLDEIYLE